MRSSQSSISGKPRAKRKLLARRGRPGKPLCNPWFSLVQIVRWITLILALGAALAGNDQESVLRLIQRVLQSTAP